MSEDNTATLVKDKKPTKAKIVKVSVDPNKRVQSELVDQIALIDTLGDVREDLRDQVLALALDEGAKYVDGTLASATVAVNNEPTEVVAQKFYDLIKKKKITIKDFVACITVNKAKAAKIIGQKELDAISDVLPPKNPSLIVKQKDDAAPPQLTDVLQQLEPVVKRFKQKRADASSAESETQAIVEQPTGLQ